MILATTRFGELTISGDDILSFVDGLIGMEELRRWVLLADAQNSALGWMQSVDRPDVALAVVSPRRFLPEYQARVSRRDILPLKLAAPGDAQILVIVSQSGAALSLNLKAPLVINLDQRLGRQVIARDDHAVQHPLTAPLRLRKSA
jgi:flagellar assembly factor FliW